MGTSKNHEPQRQNHEPQRHRDTEKSEESEGSEESGNISGFLAFDFLCASVSLWLTGFYGFL
jgi:hypothetical protein